FILQNSFNEYKAFVQNCRSVRSVERWGDYCVGDSSLIFKTEENKALGCARPLSSDDASRYTHIHAVGYLGQFFCGSGSSLTQLLAPIEEGMIIHAQTRAAIVGYETFCGAHAMQR